MRRKSVLLVDDEQLILKSLGNYLEKNAFNVIQATSGETALALFRSSSFDLVITDLAMDGISGLEVLQEVKQNNSEVGVFILTGQSKTELVIDALRAGANDFFLKPCDPDELLFKMNNFFEKQDVLKKIKIYEKFLPICMYCKKIRDDSGREPGTGKWFQLEEYLLQKSDANLSHGCCPECFEMQKKINGFQ